MVIQLWRRLANAVSMLFGKRQSKSSNIRKPKRGDLIWVQASKGIECYHLAQMVSDQLFAYDYDLEEAYNLEGYKWIFKN